MWVLFFFMHKRKKVRLKSKITSLKRIKSLSIKKVEVTFGLEITSVVKVHFGWKIIAI